MHLIAVVATVDGDRVIRVEEEGTEPEVVAARGRAGADRRRRRGDPCRGQAGVSRAARTLAGRTIVVTRPQDQSARLVDGPAPARGARHRRARRSRSRRSARAALTRALKDLTAGDYAWITLTSRATVDDARRAPRLARGTCARDVAVIGDGTAEAFRRWAAARARPAAARPSPRPRSRARSRGAGVGSCAPAPTSRPRGSRRRSPRRAGPPSASTPTGRAFPRTLPERGARRAEGGRGRRRDVHERVDRPRVRGRARRRAGHAEGRVHRSRHREAGARARIHRGGGGDAAHDGGAGRRPGARAASARRLGAHELPSATAAAACDARRPCASLVRETTLDARRPHRAAVREGGHRRAVPIASMPGQFQHTLESLRKEAVDIAATGRHHLHALRHPGATRTPRARRRGTPRGSRSGRSRRSARSSATSTSS